MSQSTTQANTSPAPCMPAWAHPMVSAPCLQTWLWGAAEDGGSSSLSSLEAFTDAVHRNDDFFHQHLPPYVVHSSPAPSPLHKQAPCIRRSSSLTRPLSLPIPNPSSLTQTPIHRLPPACKCSSCLRLPLTSTATSHHAARGTLRASPRHPPACLCLEPLSTLSDYLGQCRGLWYSLELEKPFTAQFTSGGLAS